MLGNERPVKGHKDEMFPETNEPQTGSRDDKQQQQQQQQHGDKQFRVQRSQTAVIDQQVC